MDETKERLTREEASAATLIACEHRHRYTLGAALFAGKRVLDLCCGSGYGTLLLAESAHSVHGVDFDPGTIAHAAAAAPTGSAVSFEVGDALEFLQRPDIVERFDAIVCFEGLEHLHQLDATLERLRNLAEAGVTMILSVPNSRGLGEENEFHVTDFSWEEAVERIGSFPGATVLTQYLAEGSVLCGADEWRGVVGGEIVLEDRNEPEYANHFVICVGVEPTETLATLQLAASPLSNRYMRSIERANAALRLANRRLARAQLGKFDSSAASLVEEFRDRTLALEKEYADLKLDYRGWIERGLAAEAREEELRQQVAALEARLNSLPVRAAEKLVKR